jgi:hypothetical protein
MCAMQGLLHSRRHGTRPRLTHDFLFAEFKANLTRKLLNYVPLTAANNSNNALHMQPGFDLSPQLPSPHAKKADRVRTGMLGSRLPSAVGAVGPKCSSGLLRAVDCEDPGPTCKGMLPYRTCKYSAANRYS